MGREVDGKGGGRVEGEEGGATKINEEKKLIKEIKKPCLRK